VKVPNGPTGHPFGKHCGFGTSGDARDFGDVAGREFARRQGRVRVEGNHLPRRLPAPAGTQWWYRDLGEQAVARAGLAAEHPRAPEGLGPSLYHVSAASRGRQQADERHAAVEGFLAQGRCHRSRGLFGVGMVHVGRRLDDFGKARAAASFRSAGPWHRHHQTSEKTSVHVQRVDG
jgi:hypothetical protein